MTIAELKSGEAFPDQLYGWNTKTILAALLVLMVLKIRYGGGNA